LLLSLSRAPLHRATICLTSSSAALFGDDRESIE
jgi:hypothetical protein